MVGPVGSILSNIIAFLAIFAFIDATVKWLFSMLLLEELLGAYKVQSLSRLKPGKYLHSQGLEEIKIQLYKVHSRFQILEEDSKEAIDKIVKKTTSEASFSDLIQNVNKSIEINNVQKAEF